MNYKIILSQMIRTTIIMMTTKFQITTIYQTITDEM